MRPKESKIIFFARNLWKIVIDSISIHQILANIIIAGMVAFDPNLKPQVPLFAVTMKYS